MLLLDQKASTRCYAPLTPHPYSPVLLALCELRAHIDVLRADAKAHAPACGSIDGVSAAVAEAELQKGRPCPVAVKCTLGHVLRTLLSIAGATRGAWASPSPATTPHMPPVLSPATPMGAPPKPQPAYEREQRWAGVWWEHMQAVLRQRKQQPRQQTCCAPKFAHR